MWVFSLIVLTRSIDNLPGQFVRLCYLRLGCNEDNELELVILAVLAGFFQSTVLVVDVRGGVDGEHFRFGD